MNLVAAVKIFVALGCYQPPITAQCENCGTFSYGSGIFYTSETKVERLERELKEEKAIVKKNKDCAEAYEVMSK